MNTHSLDLFSLLTPIGIESYTSKSNTISQFLLNWYDCDNYTDAYQRLREKLAKLNQAKVCVVGFPCDNGAGLERGSKFAPMAIRSFLFENNPNILSEWEEKRIIDIGDVFDHPLLVHDSMYEPWVLNQVRESRWGTANQFPVSPLSILSAVMGHLHKINPSLKVCILGGDHSLSFIPVEHLALHRSIGVIHFDAHTDLLKERQGLPYSYATWAWRANQCIGKNHRMIQIGIRQTMKSKQEWETEGEVSQLWSDEIHKDEEKALISLENMLDRLPVREAYLSFDIDALSSEYVKATGTQSAEGLNPNFIEKALKCIKNKVNILGADLVELAPGLCRNDPNEPDRSLNTACSILKNLLSLLIK
jgi:agmatinase